MGSVETHWYDDELLLDDYVSLAKGDSAGNSWLFRVEVDVPGVGSRRYLAWTGYRSYELQNCDELRPGPAIFWSVPDSSGYRKWKSDDAAVPGIAELTLRLPDVDRWIVRLPDGGISQIRPSAVARRIAEAIIGSLTKS